MAGRRPNVLFIEADQHRYDCVGANGHPFLRTPNLDRLAAGGVNFAHAYTPCPVCIPSRASLLHGVWPSVHLAVANRSSEAPRPPADGLPSYSRALSECGYRLAYIGKWGVYPERPPLEFGFHRYVPEKGYHHWRSEQGLPPVPKEGGWWGGLDPHIGPEQSRLAWEANQIIAQLRSWSDGDAPFLISWNLDAPHPPSVVPEPYCSLYPPESVPPWPSFPDPLAGKPYIQAQQRRSWGVDGWTWREWAPVVARYLGEISLIDAQVGRVLDALEELGLAGDTIVVYTSDHGALRGGHGMMDKHYVMYDDVVRVPLIVRWPGVARTGALCRDFVCHSLDLAYTICQAAGAPVPERFQGTSLLPLLRGEGGNGRRDIFSTYYGSQFGLYSQRMVRDRRWKYVWNAVAEDELYDLEQDAGELLNLAGDPQFREVLAHYRQRTVAWMEETEDRLLNQWTREQLLRGLKA